MQRQAQIFYKPQVEGQIIQTAARLVFKEYSSLELSTRDKIIQSIRNKGFDKQNIQWVVCEKIHGSNFSVHCSSDEIKYGRRTDFLTKAIPFKCQDVTQYFKESFFNAANLVNSFHNKISNIFFTLKGRYPDMVKFTLYGQYFGGNYPGIVNQDLKAIQKGVLYTPNHEYFVFDILIFQQNRSFWVDVSHIPLCLQDNLKSVPIYARGTFDQMFNMNSIIDSTIPEILGLDKIDENIIQGFVIRPNQNLTFSNGARVILKKKNQEFLQKVGRPKKKQVDKNIDPEVFPVLQFLEAYLNINRIESTTSKYPDVVDRNKLKHLIIEDILSDAVKDQFISPKEELMKKVKLQLEKKVIKLVNEYFVNH